MKELLKIAQAVNDVRYTDLKETQFVGLDNVIPAIQDDVLALKA